MRCAVLFTLVVVRLDWLVLAFVPLKDPAQALICYPVPPQQEGLPGVYSMSGKKKKAKRNIVSHLLESGKKFIGDIVSAGEEKNEKDDDEPEDDEDDEGSSEQETAAPQNNRGPNIVIVGPPVPVYQNQTGHNEDKKTKGKKTKNKKTKNTKTTVSPNNDEPIVLVRPPTPVQYQPGYMVGAPAQVPVQYQPGYMVGTPAQVPAQYQPGYMVAASAQVPVPGPYSTYVVGTPVPVPVNQYQPGPNTYVLG